MALGNFVISQLDDNNIEWLHTSKLYVMACSAFFSNNMDEYNILLNYSKSSPAYLCGSYDWNRRKYWQEHGSTDIIMKIHAFLLCLGLINCFNYAIDYD